MPSLAFMRPTAVSGTSAAAELMLVAFVFLREKKWRMTPC